MMNTISFTDLPPEIICMITNQLSISDLSSCSQVSHVWKEIFDFEIVWEPIATKMEINKLDPILEKNNRYFHKNRYRILIYKKILMDEETIREKYPKDDSDLFYRLKDTKGLREGNINRIINAKVFFEQKIRIRHF